MTIKNEVGLAGFLSAHFFLVSISKNLRERKLPSFLDLCFEMDY